MPRKARALPWLDTRNGTYYANWYEAPGSSKENFGSENPKPKGRTRAVSLGTSDPAQAATKFAALLGRGSSLYVPGVETFGITVSKVLADYEIEHVNTPKVVAKQRQIDAIKHLRAFFGSTPLKDVDIPASRGYAAARRSGAIGGGKRCSGENAKGSDPTIRRELGVLLAAIAHARKWKRLGGAEPSIERPSDAAPDENLWLTRDEVRALHAAAAGPVKDFIMIAYYTAARRASIERLRVEQVNLSTGRLSLRKAGAVVTKKRRPVLAIHPSIREPLTRLCAGAADGWLFGPRVDFYVAFRDAARKAGVDEARAHPHVLRHSRATHLLQDGKTIWEVAKLLGDTVATTERVYGHHCAEYLGNTIGDD